MVISFNSCSASSDVWIGKLVVTGSEDATVRVWDPKSKGSNATVQLQGHGFHTDAIICMNINSSNLVVTGSQDNTAKVSNLSTGKVLGNLVQHSDSVETVGFSSR